MANKFPNQSGLTPWKKGQSGNPAGMPKGGYGVDLTKSGKNAKPIRISVSRAIAERLIFKAINGNMRAVEILLSHEDKIRAMMGTDDATRISIGDTIINFGVNLDHLPIERLAEFAEPIFRAKQQKLLENKSSEK
jgi:hypothetical protein